MGLAKFVGAALIAAATMAIGAAGASAATLSSDGTTVTYTAGPGELQNWVDVRDSDPGKVEVSDFTTSDAVVLGANCAVTGGAPGLMTYKCDGSNAVVNLGAGADKGGNDTTGIPVTVNAGDGDDQVYPGPGPEVLNGGPGKDTFGSAVGDPGQGGGGDAFDGGPGDDTFFIPLHPGDVIGGGSGIDQLFVYAPTGSSGSFSLNDAADDGFVDWTVKTSILSDVEDLINTVSDWKAWGFSMGAGTQQGALNLRGDAAANRLTGSDAGDDLDGLAGNDTLTGGPGDDTLRSVDGSIDRVSCGTGADTAIADTRDEVSDSCESVTTQNVGNADGVASPDVIEDDAPPSVSLDSPAPGGRLIAGPNLLRASAGDDKGVTAVRFYDDDRLVCTDGEAPFTCGYTPTGDDVGRNTFTAEAVDTAGQTASARAGGVVPKFVPSGVTVRVRAATGSRSLKLTTSGKLQLPDGVSVAQGCSGVVTVEVRRRKRLVSKRTATLSRTCAYRSQASLRGTRSMSGLRVTARFGGNEVIAPRSGAAASARRR